MKKKLRNAVSSKSYGQGSLSQNHQGAAVPIQAVTAQDITRLMNSASSGEMSTLRDVLAIPGINLDILDPRWGDTALHKAIADGRLEAVTALLKAGACTNVPSIKGETAIHYAAYYGNLAILTAVLAKSSPDNINMKEKCYGDTALHKVISSDFIKDELNRFKALQLLVEAKADLKIPNTKDETPAFYAAWNCDLRSMDLLVAKGVNLNARELLGGDWLLHKVASSKKGINPAVKVAMVMLLVAGGVTVDCLSKKDESPLLYAAWNNDADAALALRYCGANMGLSADGCDAKSKALGKQEVTEVLNMTEAEIGTKVAGILKISAEDLQAMASPQNGLAAIHQMIEDWPTTEEPAEDVALAAAGGAGLLNDD